jgi:hypothetical protein
LIALSRSIPTLDIAHAICGGVALCMHGYQRNTTDLDVIVKQSDAAAVKQLLVGEGYLWDDRNKSFEVLVAWLFHF